jgi:hypothetical protein
MTEWALPVPRPDLVLRGRVIKALPCVVFLGVKIDQELRWKEQGAKTLAKGQDWVAKMGRLAHVSRGVATCYLRRLYISVAVSRILYVADVFLNPGQRRLNRRGGDSRGGRAIVTKLAAIQRWAAILITGAMRTTAADVLDAHATISFPSPSTLLRKRFLQEAHPSFSSPSL